MFHHLLNLQSQTINRGSPNNNETDIPDVYERPVHRGNRTLLLSSGINTKMTVKKGTEQDLTTTKFLHLTYT